MILNSPFLFPLSLCSCLFPSFCYHSSHSLYLFLSMLRGYFSCKYIIHNWCLHSTVKLRYFFHCLNFHIFSFFFNERYLANPPRITLTMQLSAWDNFAVLITAVCCNNTLIDFAKSLLLRNTCFTFPVKVEGNGPSLPHILLWNGA